MIRKSVYAALLAGSVFAYSSSALAQDAPAEQQAEPTEPDQSDAAADAAIAAAQPVDELQAKIEMLQAQVEALQESLEAVKSAQVKATPSWKGAPLFEDKEGGWSFKPRGRLMYDIGWVESPEGIDNGGLGFSNEVREQLNRQLPEIRRTKPIIPSSLSARWVEPRLTCRISYTTRTATGALQKMEFEDLLAEIQLPR